MAMAPTLHLKITFDPPLPALRNQLIQRVPMGSCIKNNVCYVRPFWKEKGSSHFYTFLHVLESSPVVAFV